MTHMTSSGSYLMTKCLHKERNLLLQLLSVELVPELLQCKTQHQAAFIWNPNYIRNLALKAAWLLTCKTTWGVDGQLSKCLLEKLLYATLISPGKSSKKRCVIVAGVIKVLSSWGARFCLLHSDGPSAWSQGDLLSSARPKTVNKTMYLMDNKDLNCQF